MAWHYTTMLRLPTGTGLLDLILDVASVGIQMLDNNGAIGLDPIPTVLPSNVRIASKILQIQKFQTLFGQSFPLIGATNNLGFRPKLILDTLLDEKFHLVLAISTGLTVLNNG